LFTGQQYRARIGTIDDYEEDHSASARIEAWEAGLAMFQDNPIFGVGLKRFVYAFPYYSAAKPREAHNSWVQMAAECGAVALGCYGLLLVFTVRSLWRARRRARPFERGDGRLVRALSLAFEGSLVGYVVCGSFLSMEDMEFFYVLAAFAVALDRLSAAHPRARADARPEALPAEVAA